MWFLTVCSICTVLKSQKQYRKQNDHSLGSWLNGKAPLAFLFVLSVVDIIWNNRCGNFGMLIMQARNKRSILVGTCVVCLFVKYFKEINYLIYIYQATFCSLSCLAIESLKQMYTAVPSTLMYILKSKKNCLSTTI